MRTNRITLAALVLFVTGVAGFAAGNALSQDAPASYLGQEHEWLATLAGDYTAKVGGTLGESDGVSRIETKLGGLWSFRRFESSLMGSPYEGLEILGFDPEQGTFVSVWADSLTPKLMTMEGTYDAATKTLTMRGLSVGMDGEQAEMVNTTTFRADGMTFTMNIAGMTAPLMTIDSTRKR